MSAAGWDGGAPLRLGVAGKPSPNAQYRAYQPMHALARRGHALVLPDPTGVLDPRRFADCDVVHVYGWTDLPARRAMRELTRLGKPFVFDVDDDVSAAPKESAAFHRQVGGLKGQRLFLETVQAARMAHTVTTTTELLAAKYRGAGIERVSVVGNYLVPDLPRPRIQHEGIVIGWIAAGEHYADAIRLKLGDTLRRVLADHPNVRVHSIGIGLGLGERYRRWKHVPFHELPARTAEFDIGIAPLVDTPMNRARSDIKVKEYAASGVPWLASPVGPYAGLGEDQGGRLVPDDQWYEALTRLVEQPSEREHLSRRGREWAAQHTMEAGVQFWEEVFTRAAGRPARVAGPPKVEASKRRFRLLR